MKSFVVDASVIIKWIFPENINEDHLPQALHVLGALKKGAIQVLQPPHWLVEVASVIVRLNPKISDETVHLLHAMELPIETSPDVYTLACQLSQHFNHHLFDTLYHAVALYHGSTKFITADEQYYRKAYKKGGIIRLADFYIFDD